jgi:branched-chain amino acid transport system permease protein
MTTAAEPTAPADDRRPARRPGWRPVRAQGGGRASSPYADGAGFALMIVAALVFGSLASGFALSVANTVLYTVLLTLGLNLVVGYTGQLDFGHAAFFGIGGYVAAKLMLGTPGIDFLLVLLVSAGAGMAASALIGLPVFRFRGHFLALVTLAFGEIVHTLGLNLEWTGGANGLPGIPPAQILGFEFSDNVSLYWLGLVLVTIAGAVVFFLVTRRPGRAMMAVRDDELAARASGIRPFWYKQLAFTVAGGMAGVAGAYFAAFFAFVGPDSFNLELSILLVEMVFLGGLGSISGSVLGAAVFVVAQTLLITQVPAIAGHQNLVVGAAVLAFIIARPQGIAGQRFVGRRT